MSPSLRWARDSPAHYRRHRPWRRRRAAQAPDLRNITLKVHVPNTCIPPQAVGGCRVASELTSCLHVCCVR